jgi:hypothetical protein
VTPYQFTDSSGDELEIRSWSDDDGTAAMIDTDPAGANPAVRLPPHEVPGAARALYEAAGLPVPDLPDIPDPALVDRLAADLMESFNPGAMGLDGARPHARRLLAKGWRPS